MSDDKLLRESAKGAKAAALLQDETLMEAFAKLRDAYIKGWRNTEPRDTEAREMLWIAVNQLEKLQDHIAIMAANGKLAKAQLERIAELEGKNGKSN